MNRWLRQTTITILTVFFYWNETSQFLLIIICHLIDVFILYKLRRNNCSWRSFSCKIHLNKMTNFGHSNKTQTNHQNNSFWCDHSVLRMKMEQNCHNIWWTEYIMWNKCSKHTQNHRFFLQNDFPAAFIWIKINYYLFHFGIFEKMIAIS